jgi:hypothetical protein
MITRVGVVMGRNDLFRRFPAPCPFGVIPAGAMRVRPQFLQHRRKRLPTCRPRQRRDLAFGEGNHVLNALVQGAVDGDGLGLAQHLEELAHAGDPREGIRDVPAVGEVPRPSGLLWAVNGQGPHRWHPHAEASLQECGQSRLRSRLTSTS